MLRHTPASSRGGIGAHIHEFVPVTEEHPFANLLREFSMEGLAILLPGFGFVAASIPAIWLPLFFFAVTLDYRASLWGIDATTAARLHTIEQIFGISINGPHFFDIFTKVLNLFSTFHVEFFIAITGISYMLGHLMFRRDPKVPDYMSFIKINSTQMKGWRRPVRWLLRIFGRDFSFRVRYGNERIEELRGWNRLKTVVIQKERYSDFEDMARPQPWQRLLDPEIVQFPYNHLKDYLQERNFKTLEKFIYWDEDTKYRSKYFINALKINLEFLFPKESRRIFINEGHTRLASSVWYACKYVRVLALIGVILSIFGSAMLNFQHLSIIIVPFVTIILSVVIQSSTELTFHYQRCREVFYVIQLALLASEFSDQVLSGIPKADDMRWGDIC